MSTEVMSNYRKARIGILEEFKKAGKRGLSPHEIYSLMEERGITDERITQRAINDWYNEGFIEYREVPEEFQPKPIDPLNPVYNMYCSQFFDERD